VPGDETFQVANVEPNLPPLGILNERDETSPDRLPHRPGSQAQIFRRSLQGKEARALRIAHPLCAYRVFFEAILQGCVPILCPSRALALSLLQLKNRLPSPPDLITTRIDDFYNLNREAGWPLSWVLLNCPPLLPLSAVSSPCSRVRAGGGGDARLWPQRNSARASSSPA